MAHTPVTIIAPEGHRGQPPDEAIHAAAHGEALIAPTATARLLAAFFDAANRPPPPEPRQPLTDREEEVLTAVARGLTNAEIADQLHIGLSTVKRPPRQPHG